MAKFYKIFFSSEMKVSRLTRPQIGFERNFEKNKTSQVSSMIHLPRLTGSSVATIVFCCFVWLDLNIVDGRTDERTDNMCENNDPYRQ